MRDLQDRAQSAYVDAMAPAVVQVALGDWEGAAASLAKAREERSPLAAFAGVDPLFEPLRAHPRAEALEPAAARRR